MRRNKYKKQAPRSRSAAMLCPVSVSSADSEAGRTFRAGFTALLDGYGDTTNMHLLDMSTWREDPTTPLRMVAAMTRQPDDQSPEAAEAAPRLFAGVRLVNGFSNTLPWPASGEMPARVTALSHHPYANRRVYPAAKPKGTRVEFTARLRPLTR